MPSVFPVQHFWTFPYCSARTLRLDCAMWDQCVPCEEKVGHKLCACHSRQQQFVCSQQTPQRASVKRTSIPERGKGAQCGEKEAPRTRAQKGTRRADKRGNEENDIRTPNVATGTDGVVVRCVMERNVGMARRAQLVNTGITAVAHAAGSDVVHASIVSVYARFSKGRRGESCEQLLGLFLQCRT